MNAAGCFDCSAHTSCKGQPPLFDVTGQHTGFNCCWLPLGVSTGNRELVSNTTLMTHLLSSRPLYMACAASPSSARMCISVKKPHRSACACDVLHNGRLLSVGQL